MLFILVWSALGYMMTPTRAVSKAAAPMTLSMGLFDFLKASGPKPSAAARHILVKGKDGPVFLENLKLELNANSNVEKAFARAATQHSACPSSKKGGALGEFKQGTMVPAFDKVVFSEKVGEIHGPVKTPFGAHLIFIQDRYDE